MNNPETSDELNKVVFSPRKPCNIDEIIQNMRLCNIATVRSRLEEIQRKPAVWSIVGPIVVMLFEKQEGT